MFTFTFCPKYSICVCVLIKNKINFVHKMENRERLMMLLLTCFCGFSQVVVFFVMCVLLGLGGYMLYLVVVEPMLRQQQPFIPYRRHGADGGDTDVGLNTFWFHQQDSGSDREATDTLASSDMDEPTVTSIML